jgi:uncharacterized membrane protein HdeD (DUF308 family)
LRAYFPTKSSELFRGRGWVVLLRGLTAIAFGVLAAVGPRVTLSTLVILFGIYALVHGILSLAAAVGGRGQRGSMLLAVEGIVGLLAGVLTLRRMHPSIMALVFSVWLWSIATGILRIAEAIRLRKEIPGDIWLALSGIVPVFLALLLFSQRIIGGTVGLALLIAIPAVIWGVFEILLGWELRAVRYGPSTGRA